MTNHDKDYQRAWDWHAADQGSVYHQHKTGINIGGRSTGPNDNRPGGDACFPGWAPVLTLCGLRPIAEIAIGDMVAAYNRHTGSITAGWVIRTLAHGYREIWTIESDARTDIEATASHSFLTRTGWKKLSALRPGDCIVRMDGNCRVKRVARSGRIVPVYNLVTEGEHTFIAYGCVAHNFTHLRALRAWLYRWGMASGHGSQGYLPANPFNAKSGASCHPGPGD